MKINTDTETGIKILFLEDSKQDFEIIENQLLDSGLDLTMNRVENEQDFLSELHNLNYDIILSDFNLPSYDAFQAIEKTQELYPEIPIVIVSGTVGEETAIELIKKGATDYIIKDKPERLPIAIKRAIYETHRKMELKMLSMTTEQSVEAVVITDIKGNIRYINPAFEKITGYSRGEILGRNPNILKSNKQEDSIYKDLWNKITQGEIWEGNLINRRKDGSLYTENAIISPLLNASGNITHYIGVKRDITKELDLQNQLNQSQKLECIGNLASGVAHDFNNILTIIKSYSELLSLKISDKELNGFVQKINSAADKAAALTKQLLAFSRKQVIITEPLNLNELVRNIEEIMQRLIGEQYDLITDLQADPAIVKADAHQIEQVIMNLCINARDAMPNGGQLFIRTKNTKDQVTLIVEDSGEGMTPEVISHIFEPFFTTKPKDKGTGLGLSVLFGIVKQHHGEIFVESSPGKGSSFFINLNAYIKERNNKQKG